MRLDKECEKVLNIVVKKMQIKTTMKYNVMPVMMAVTTKLGKFWWGCREIAAVENCTIVENCGLLVGRLNGIGTLEKSMGVPQKLKIELSYDPATPLLSIYPKEMKSELQMNVYYNT